MGQFAVVRRLDQSLFVRLQADRFRVESLAVVGDDHLDLDASERGRDHDPSLRRFTGFQALLGRLQAMVHRVAHQVAKRIFEPFEDGSVQLEFAPLDDQFNFLVAHACHIADHSFQPVARIDKREHPDAPNFLVDQAGCAIQVAPFARHDRGKSIQVFLQPAEVIPDLAQSQDRTPGQSADGRSDGSAPR